MHRERAHLKVPGVSIGLNVLLTRKLPTFLPRLNRIESHHAFLLMAANVSPEHFTAQALMGNGKHYTINLHFRVIPTEVIRIFSFTSCGSLIPFTRANAQWDLIGFT